MDEQKFKAGEIIKFTLDWGPYEKTEVIGIIINLVQEEPSTYYLIEQLTEGPSKAPRGFQQGWNYEFIQTNAESLGYDVNLVELFFL